MNIKIVYEYRKRFHMKLCTSVSIRGFHSIVSEDGLKNKNAEQRITVPMGGSFIGLER